MKTSSKIIIGLVILLAGLIGYVWYLHHKKDQAMLNPLTQVAKKNIETEAKQIAKEVDENGLKHTIFKIVKEIDHDAVDKVTADLMDTVDALNIARDKLRQVVVINTNLSIQNQALERKVNELSTVYSHKDNNFDLSVNIPKDTNVAATATLGYDADLITAQYNKGSWLFGTSPYMDIYSNDPRFTIKGARTLSVKQKVPFANFEVSGNANYNQYFGVSAGPAAKLQLGRVRLSGDYKYYNVMNKWYWSAEAGYRIIGF